MFHLGILLVIVGAMVGGWFGFSGTTVVYVSDPGNISYNKSLATNRFFNWTELKEDTFDFSMSVEDYFLGYYPLTTEISIRDFRTLDKAKKVRLTERKFYQIEGTPYRILLLDAIYRAEGSEADMQFKIYENDKELGTFDNLQQIENFPYEVYRPFRLQVGLQDKKTLKKIHLYELDEREYFDLENSEFGVLLHKAVFGAKESTPRFYFTLFKSGQRVGDYYNDQDIPDFPFNLVFVNFKPPAGLPERIVQTSRVSLRLEKDGKTVAEGDVEANKPLSYNGIVFYHTAAKTDEYGLMYIGFQISKDPGLGTVYFGFAFMFLAVMPIFIVSHKKIYITTKDGNIFLVGEATKNKSDFRDEFNNYLNEFEGT